MSLIQALGSRLEGPRRADLRRDIERELVFYRDVIGLRLLYRTPTFVRFDATQGTSLALIAGGVASAEPKDYRRGGVVPEVIVDNLDLALRRLERPQRPARGGRRDEVGPVLLLLGSGGQPAPVLRIGIRPTRRRPGADPGLVPIVTRDRAAPGRGGRSRRTGAGRVRGSWVFRLLANHRGSIAVAGDRLRAGRVGCHRRRDTGSRHGRWREPGSDRTGRAHRSGIARGPAADCRRPSDHPEQRPGGSRRSGPDRHGRSDGRGDRRRPGDRRVRVHLGHRTSAGCLRRGLLPIVARHVRRRSLLAGRRRRGSCRGTDRRANDVHRPLHRGRHDLPRPAGGSRPIVSVSSLGETRLGEQLLAACVPSGRRVPARVRRQTAPRKALACAGKPSWSARASVGPASPASASGAEPGDRGRGQERPRRDPAVEPGVAAGRERRRDPDRVAGRADRRVLAEQRLAGVAQAAQRRLRVAPSRSGRARRRTRWRTSTAASIESTRITPPRSRQGRPGPPPARTRRQPRDLRPRRRSRPRPPARRSR